MVKNCRMEEMPDGTRYYYSYKTLIGLYSPRVTGYGRRTIFDETSHSRTTSKHRSAFMAEQYTCILVSREDFVRAVEQDKLGLWETSTNSARNAELEEDKRVLVEKLLDAQRQLNVQEDIIAALMERAA